MSESLDFASLLATTSDDVAVETMTMGEYLLKVAEDPSICRRAAERLIDCIDHYGHETVKIHGNKVVKYNIFDDPEGNGKDALFGSEAWLEPFVNTLRAAGRGQAASRRIILLHGPVGSAKSTVVRILKKHYEAYSRKPEGRMYTFTWVADAGTRLPEARRTEIFGKGTEYIPCPMQIDPIYLVDDSKREVFLDAIEKKTGKRIKMRGDMDPLSRKIYTELMVAYKGDWNLVMMHVRVERLVISERDRRGIGTFQPKDEKNQDSTELTGEANIRKLGYYGDDADPRAFSFNGEFQCSNRGLIEFVEMLKLQQEFLYELLTASEEQRIKPKKFPQCDIDLVIIGHNNEPELEKLEGNEFMEALRSRTIALDVPYSTSAKAEEAIYVRDYGNTGFHFAPYTLRMAAMFAVATRLAPPPTNMTRLQKVMLLDGIRVEPFTAQQVRDLIDENPREGLDPAVSPRTIQDILDRVTMEMAKEGSATGFHVINTAERLIQRMPAPSEDARQAWSSALAEVRVEYERLVVRDVQRAAAASESQSAEVFDRYMANVKAFLSEVKIKDPTTGRDVDPDEAFMEEIERRMDVNTANKREHRFQHMAWYGLHSSDGEETTYKSNAKLRRAIEDYLFSRQKDSIYLTAMAEPTTISPESKKRVDEVRQRLVDEYGYNEYTAQHAMRYAASVFVRENQKS